MVVLVLVIFGVFYYTGPNAKVSGVRWVRGGAVVALIAWIVASIVFALYVSNFGSYNKTYGALGGVVVFLLWLWLTDLAILLGAEFNAETERARQLHGGVAGAEEELRLERARACVIAALDECLHIFWYFNGSRSRFLLTVRNRLTVTWVPGLALHEVSM